jgi:hypothetical protein
MAEARPDDADRLDRLVAIKLVGARTRLALAAGEAVDQPASAAPRRDLVSFRRTQVEHGERAGEWTRKSRSSVLRNNGLIERGPACLRHAARIFIVECMRQLLLIVAAIVTAVLLTEFLFSFYDWNRMQACATAGGRNCGGPPARIER